MGCTGSPTTLDLSVYSAREPSTSTRYLPLAVGAHWGWQKTNVSTGASGMKQSWVEALDALAGTKAGMMAFREAQALLGQSKARRSLLQIGMGVELEHARRTVSAAKASVAVAATTTESARERLRLAEGRYKEGVGTALDVSDAQLGYVTAAALQVQARYELAAARAQLIHALGVAP